MRAHGDRDALSGDLDLESFAILKRIGEPPLLIDELRERIVLLDVPDGLLHVSMSSGISDVGAVARRAS